MSRVKDREGEQGKRYLDSGSHYGVNEKPGVARIIKVKKQILGFKMKIRKTKQPSH